MPVRDCATFRRFCLEHNRQHLAWLLKRGLNHEEHEEHKVPIFFVLFVFFVVPPIAQRALREERYAEA